MRKKLPDCTGATGATTLEDAKRAGSDFVVQPKMDGALARVHLDANGRIAHVFRRGGDEFGPDIVGHLVGAFVGWPHAVLEGELEAYTDASARAISKRGAGPLIHLFDCIRAGNGRYVARDPYRTRRDLLLRMQSEVVNLGCELPWYRDGARARGKRSGRFVEAQVTDWRLTPVVPQTSASRVEVAWADWVERDEGEGLVLVALNAPIGRRSAKLKLKQIDEQEAVCMSAGDEAASLLWQGLRVVVSNRGRVKVTAGQVVSFVHNGLMNSGMPRHARLSRLRPDLQ